MVSRRVNFQPHQKFVWVLNMPLNSQLATHRLVELQLTSHKLLDLLVKNHTLLGLHFTHTQHAGHILESLSY